MLLEFNAQLMLEAVTVDLGVVLPRVDAQSVGKAVIDLHEFPSAAFEVLGALWPRNGTVARKQTSAQRVATG
ncbi:hypothetical protein GCM10010038_28160 [Glutamicibacter protophormiae]|nr:hypothetical protein GCM10010038_28160 [Glutamicibacter protophormiae]